MAQLGKGPSSAYTSLRALNRSLAASPSRPNYFGPGDSLQRSGSGRSSQWHEQVSDPSQFQAAMSRWSPRGYHGGGTGDMLAEAQHASSLFAGMDRGQAINQITQYRDQLVSQGLTPDEASKYLFQTLMNIHGAHPASFGGSYQTPSSGSMGGIFSRTTSASSPSTLPGTTKQGAAAAKKANIVGAAQSMTPAGQITAQQNDPNVQAGYIINTQIPDQIFSNAAMLGQVADTYDSLAPKKRAAYLSSLGLTRTNMHIPVGTALSGDVIRAAAMHQAAQEQESLAAAQGGPGEILSGTMVYNMLTQLSNTRSKKNTLGRPLQSTLAQMLQNAPTFDPTTLWGGALAGFEPGDISSSSSTSSTTSDPYGISQDVPTG